MPTGVAFTRPGAASSTAGRSASATACDVGVGVGGGDRPDQGVGPPYVGVVDPDPAGPQTHQRMRDRGSRAARPQDRQPVEGRAGQPCRERPAEAGDVGVVPDGRAALA